jgi:DNA-binding MarR family transcriptional regulator
MKIKKYLEQSPVFAINATYESMIPQINRQLRAEGLNLLQGLVLTALFFEESKAVTPSRLAMLFQTSRGNMSHILSHLESKGWVKRVVHDKDARQFHLELKADGRKKALSLIRFYDRLQGLFEKELGIQTCHKIVDGLNSLSTAFQNSNMIDRPSKS